MPLNKNSSPAPGLCHTLREPWCGDWGWPARSVCSGSPGGPHWLLATAGLQWEPSHCSENLQLRKPRDCAEHLHGTHLLNGSAGGGITLSFLTTSYVLFLLPFFPNFIFKMLCSKLPMHKYCNEPELWTFLRLFLGLSYGKKTRSGSWPAPRAGRYLALTRGDAKRCNPLGWKSLSLVSCQGDKSNTPGTVGAQTKTGPVIEGVFKEKPIGHWV